MLPAAQSMGTRVPFGAGAPLTVAPTAHPGIRTCAVVVWPSGTNVENRVVAKHAVSMTSAAPPPMDAGKEAFRGSREATTKALREALYKTAKAANLGHPAEVSGGGRERKIQ